MEKLDDIIIDLNKTLAKIKASPLDENEQLMMFYSYFDKQYQSLSRQEKDKLLLIIKRNSSLKKILGL